MQKNTSDNFEWKKYIEKIKNGEKVKGYYFFGNTGVGKTYLLEQLKNELISAEIPHWDIYFIEWFSYIESVKKAMDSNDYSNYNFMPKDRLYNVKYLLIDDIGKDNTSEWIVNSELFPLLNYRYKNKLATFFTSNYSLEELEWHYKNGRTGKISDKSVEPVIDRLKGLTVPVEIITSNGKSRR